MPEQLELTKEVDRTEIQRSTVRVLEPRSTPSVLYIRIAADECPRWWSAERDDYLRKFWTTEPFLAGAIYSIATRNAAFRFELEGPERPVKRVQEMLSQSDLGAGWQSMIVKVSIDLLSQDNGAFIELIRPARAKTRKGWVDVARLRDRHGDMGWFLPDGKQVADKAVTDIPTDNVIGLAHLDAQRCQRTGDPDWPVAYMDTHGESHKLAWWQVLTLEEFPSPKEDMNGVGHCAVSRVLRMAQILRDVEIYKSEKVSGRFTRRVYLTNVDPQAVQDAILQAEEHADNLSLSRYMQPIIAATIDPNAEPAVQSIDLAAMPDAFDQEAEMRWYVAGLAMALGVDYGFLAPLPGGNLGTATQSETQARSARGKSSQMFMSMLEHKFNFGGVLPSSVQFRFKEIDPQEKAQEDAGAKLRAETRALRIQSGEITTTVARQIAQDEGDLEEEYVALMGEEDVTTDITADDTESVDAQQDAVDDTTPRAEPEPPEPPEPDVEGAELAMQTAAKNYLSRKISAETLAEFAIALEVERRASGVGR